MKKKELVNNIAIVFLLLLIALVVYFKFIVNKPQSPVQLHKLDQLKVADTSGTIINFETLTDKEDEVYCLVFALDDCYSCIYKGLQDLVHLQKSGRSCFGLAIHEIVGEVEGWAGQQDFSPFYMIKRVDFYTHIQTPATPVIIKVKKGKVQSYRFIKP